MTKDEKIFKRIDILEDCINGIECAYEFDESINFHIPVIDTLIEKYGDNGLKSTLLAYAEFVKEKNKYYSGKGVKS